MKKIHSWVLTDRMIKHGSRMGSPHIIGKQNSHKIRGGMAHAGIESAAEPPTFIDDQK